VTCSWHGCLQGTSSRPRHALRRSPRAGVPLLGCCRAWRPGTCCWRCPAAARRLCWRQRCPACRVGAPARTPGATPCPAARRQVAMWQPVQPAGQAGWLAGWLAGRGWHINLSGNTSTAHAANPPPCCCCRRAPGGPGVCRASHRQQSLCGKRQQQQQLGRGCDLDQAAAGGGAAAGGAAGPPGAPLHLLAWPGPGPCLRLTCVPALRPPPPPAAGRWPVAHRRAGAAAAGGGAGALAVQQGQGPARLRAAVPGPGPQAGAAGPLQELRWASRASRPCRSHPPAPARTRPHPPAPARTLATHPALLRSGPTSPPRHAHPCACAAAPRPTSPAAAGLCPPPVPGNSKVGEFLGKDFGTEANRASAANNAFALLGQHRCAQQR
jgi:hypothetical protein